MMPVGCTHPAGGDPILSRQLIRERSEYNHAGMDKPVSSGCEHVWKLFWRKPKDFVVNTILSLMGWSEAFIVFSGCRSGPVAGGKYESFRSPRLDREPGRLKAERTVSAASRSGGQNQAEVVESLSQARAMSKRLYVGNLKYTVTSAHLQELLEQYGVVTSASVLSDRETGAAAGSGLSK